MKKRLITALLVGVMAMSSVIGLAACGVGSVSMPKGEQVTKEVWKKAFTSDKLDTLKNYTLSMSGNDQVSANETYKEDDKEHSRSVSAKGNIYKTILYDDETKSFYSEETESSNQRKNENGNTAAKTYKFTEKYYKEKGEKEDEYWYADYSKKTNKDDKHTSSSEYYWDADRSSSAPSNKYSGFVSSQINSKVYSNTKEASASAKHGTISELYDLFEYSNGVYTATLYSSYDGLAEYEEIDSETSLTFSLIVVAYKVSVSFNEDGYLIGCSTKVDATDTYEMKDYGVKIDYSVKSITTYAVTNIGKSGASKRGTGDIARAIQKAKDEYAKVESKK